MSVEFELWLFVTSFGASVLGGMLGMASGVFIVPILTIFGRLDIHAAIGASIVSVIACSCGGAGPFLKAGLTNLRLAVVLEVATTLGALSGVALAGLVSARALFLIFSMVLAVSAWQMLMGRRKPDVAAATPSAKSSRLRLDASYPDPKLGRDVHYNVERLPLGMGMMYAAGLLSALLGIGSGVLKVPAMDAVLRLPMKVSSATSNFMIGVTAAASASAYFFRGDIVPGIAGPVALGSVAGAALGARILLIVPTDKLRGLFIGALAILAVQMLLAGFGVDLARLNL
jgi:uncharacterized membrane protein YfcA